MTMELRLLLRSPLIVAAVIAAMSVTTLALIVGIAQVRHVESAIHEAVAFDTRALAEAQAEAKIVPLDAGMFGYGTMFAVPHPPAPGAWFNLGDTLSQSPVQRLRLLGLQGQVHDGTGGNPAVRAAGAFDAAFVLTVLLPLLAAAVFAPLAAEEREARRDGLLAALVAAPRPFWLRRVAARGVLVLVPVLLPIVVALVATGASPAFSFGVLGGVVLYALGWISLCAALALRLRGSSDAVAARLVALWALVALVLPALGGLALDRLAPTVPGSAIALAHRDAVSSAWDQPKAATFDAFFEHHPEWRGTSPVTTRFHWKWYYAFHLVADRRVEPLLRESRDAMRDRQRARDALGMLLPPVALQNLFDGLSDQGIEGEWARKQAARDFHDHLRVAFYPFVFNEQPVTAADIAALPVPAPSERGLRHRPAAWAGLGLFALIGFGALWRSARRVG